MANRVSNKLIITGDEKHIQAIKDKLHIKITDYKTWDEELQDARTIQKQVVPALFSNLFGKPDEARGWAEDVDGYIDVYAACHLLFFYSTRYRAATEIAEWLAKDNPECRVIIEYGTCEGGDYGGAMVYYDGYLIKEIFGSDDIETITGRCDPDANTLSYPRFVKKFGGDTVYAGALSSIKDAIDWRDIQEADCEAR